jgi:ribosome-associated protein
MTRQARDPPGEEAGQEGPSKSARKRAAHESQRLGVRLVELPDADLAALGLPERLLDALRQARSITSRAGLARQRQYIGKLMRDLDPQQISASLEERDRRRALEAQRQRRIEEWRLRLLREGVTALEHLVASHPRADRAAFARLVAEAGNEDAPESLRIAAARELFRALRELLAAAPANL